jgi:hypothetical protein
VLRNRRSAKPTGMNGNPTHRTYVRLMFGYPVVKLFFCCLIDLG